VPRYKKKKGKPTQSNEIFALFTFGCITLLYVNSGSTKFFTSDLKQKKNLDSSLIYTDCRYILWS